MLKQQKYYSGEESFEAFNVTKLEIVRDENIKYTKDSPFERHLKLSESLDGLVLPVQEGLPDEHNSNMDEGEEHHPRGPRHQHPEMGGGRGL